MIDEKRDSPRVRRLDHRVPRARGLRLGRAREPRLLPAVRAARRSLLGLGPFQRLLARKSIDARRAARRAARARRRLRPRLHDGAARRARAARCSASTCCPENSERRAREVRRSAARALRVARRRRSCPRPRGGVALEAGTFDAVHCLEVALPLRREGPRATSWPRAGACCARAGGWCWWTSSGATRTPEAIERLDRAAARARHLVLRASSSRSSATARSRAALGFRERAILDWTAPGDRPLPAHRDRPTRAPAPRRSGARSCARSGPATRA